MHNQLNLFSNLLQDKFKEVLKDKSCTLHFHTQNMGTFCYLIDNSILTLSNNLLFYKYQFEADKVTEPYEPFLYIIREAASKLKINIDKLLDKAKVYPSHRVLFEAYLQNETPQRLDEIVFDELQYEYTQMRKSICNLIKIISKDTPIVIAIADLQHADFDTLELIKSISNNVVKSKAMFIYCYNKNYFFQDSARYDIWSSFTSLAEERFSIMELAQDFYDYEDNWYSPYFDLTVDELIRISSLNFSFLNFNKAIKYASMARNLILNNSVNEETHFAMIQILADSHFYLGEIDNALTYYRILSEIAHRANNFEMLSEAYRKTALAYLRNYDVNTATKLSSQCLKYAALTKDEFQLLRAYHLLYCISDKTTHPMDRDRYFLLLNLLEKYNLKNTYVHCLKNASLYSDYYANVSDLHALCDKAIEISLENQNEFALFVNYHKKGVIYSFNEDYENALVYFLKSKDLRLKLGYPLHLIRIYNGIGYLYMLTEKYKDAQRYYQKAISQLHKIHDFNEVSATLSNYAFLHLISRNYKECVKIIDKLLQIMKIFNITYLPYRTITDIYVLKALCFFKLGEYFKAADLVNRIEAMSSIKPTHTYIFLYCMLKGLLYAENKQYDLAVNSFENAICKLDPANKSSNFMLPMYYLEYGDLLFKMNSNDHAVEVLKKGLDLCEKMNYVYYKELIQKLLDGKEYKNESYKLSRVDLDLESIIELAKQDITLNKLQKKIREIEFISKIQELSSTLLDKNAIIEEYLKLIHVNFPVDVVNLYYNQDKEYTCIGSKSTAITKVEVSIEYIKSLMDKKTPQLINLSNEKTSLDLNINDTMRFIVNIPVKYGHSSYLDLFVATINPQTTLTQDDLNILSISINQLSTILAKVEQDLELLRSSRTDQLTGLNNRQALQIAFNEEILRIKNAPDNIAKDISVIFIDLDNFKYYNDTFGHNAGDLILKSFANILMQYFRPSDFVARFGGDEFVIILPDTSEETANKLGQGLLYKLCHEAVLKKCLSDILGVTVNIPENKLLTCSIGIASHSFTKDDVDKLDVLLHYADKAQYIAKNSGKNAVSVYSDS